MKIFVKIIYAALSVFNLLSGLVAIALAIAANYLPALSFASVIITIIASIVSAATMISSCLFVGNKFIRITFIGTAIGLILAIAAAFIVFI